MKAECGSGHANGAAPATGDIWTQNRHRKGRFPGNCQAGAHARQWLRRVFELQRNLDATAGMPPMQRVLVIGCSGAGKSTFSRRLAALTGLPVIHLDQEFWQPDWMPMAPAAWRARVAAMTAEPRWIMDGQFGGTLGLRLSRADTVFILDVPRWRCLTRVLRRTCWNFGRTRPDMAPGCAERLDWEFLRYIWNYNRDHRPRHLAALDGFGGTVVILKRPSDVKACLDKLERDCAPAPAS